MSTHPRITVEGLDPFAWAAAASTRPNRGGTAVASLAGTSQLSGAGTNVVGGGGPLLSRSLTDLTAELDKMPNRGEVHSGSDTANPRHPIAGDPFPVLTAEEHEALRVEGVAQGLYDAHAARMGRAGTPVPKFGWLTDSQRDGWRTLARERIADGAEVGRDVVERVALMPNVVAIRAWVEDLRSGRFQRGENVLRHGDQYCCMGVACETHKRLSDVPYEWTEGEGVGDLAYAREDQVLPDPVMNWLGVGSTDPELEKGDGSKPDSCSTLNDILKWDFNQIADAIERTYLSGAGGAS